MVAKELDKFNAIEGVEAVLAALKAREFLPPIRSPTSWICWEEVKCAILCAVGLCSMACLGTVDSSAPSEEFCLPPCVFDVLKGSCSSHISVGCTVTTWSATGIPHKVTVAVYGFSIETSGNFVFCIAFLLQASWSMKAMVINESTCCAW
jgi:hypothetical protein